jgi:fused signal recognition particle receptor
VAFFKKLKERMFNSSSKIDEGLEAIVSDGGTEEAVESADQIAASAQAEAETLAAREAAIKDAEAKAAAVKEAADRVARGRNRIAGRGGASGTRRSGAC